MKCSNFIASLKLFENFNLYEIIVSNNVMTQLIRFETHMTTLNRLHRWFSNWTWKNQYELKLIVIMQRLFIQKFTTINNETIKTRFEKREFVTSIVKRKSYKRIRSFSIFIFIDNIFRKRKKTSLQKNMFQKRLFEN